MTTSSIDRIGDRYDILDRIKVGGGVAVYKARHRLLDEIRVIKVVRPHHQAGEHRREELLGDVRRASRLRHLRIAQSYDFTIDDDGCAHIIREYVPGLDLAELAARCGPLPVALALEIGCQALDAVAYLHRRGVVHGDLSADCFVLSSGDRGEPHLKLIDVGVGRTPQRHGWSARDGEGNDRPCLAPEWVAPSSGGAPDGRADLYSIGVILAELVAGEPPRSALPAAAVPVDPEGRIPDPLRSVLARALAEHPRDRFDSAETMAAELQRLQALFPLPAGAMESLQEAVETSALGAVAAASGAAGLGDGATLVLDLAQIEPGEGGERSPETEAGDTAEIARSAEMIEVCLDVGKLEEAENRLGEAVARFGRVEVLDRLEGRRAEMHDSRLKAADLVEEALAEIRAANLEAAVETLRSAARHDPFSDQVTMLVEIGERALLKERGAARALDEVPRAAAEVEELLYRAEYELAAEALSIATRTFGDRDVFRALHQRVTEERGREHRVLIHGHLDAARRRASAGDYSSALAELRQASALAPGDAEIAAELERVMCQHAASTIRDYLQRGDLAEARRALSVAEKIHRGNEELAGLRAEFERRAQSTSSALVKGLLRSARLFLEVGDFANALAELRRAGRTDPLDAEIRDLTQETMQRQAETTIESYLDRGQVAEAERALALAVKVHGESPGVAVLRGRLERLEVEGGETTVTTLLAGARRLIDDEDDRAALRLLLRAGGLDPGNDEVAVLTREAVRRQVEGAIADHLDRGALAEAEAAIVFAEKLYGESPSLVNLRDRLIDAL